MALLSASVFVTPMSYYTYVDQSQIGGIVDERLTDGRSAERLQI
jgi:hypothetical protein